MRIVKPSQLLKKKDLTCSLFSWSQTTVKLLVTSCNFKNNLIAQLTLVQFTQFGITLKPGVFNEGFENTHTVIQVSRMVILVGNSKMLGRNV